MRASRFIVEMQGWTWASHLVPIALFLAYVHWWWAWHLRRRSALARGSWCEPLANWVCWASRGVCRRDWPPPLCWLWAKTMDLRVPWEILSQVMLALREVIRTSRDVEPFALSKSVRASLWEVSEETWEWVSEETFQYCRVELGLKEPEERSSLAFSWSNLTTSDLTIDPRNLRLVCAMAFWSVEKTIPMELPSFICKENLKDCKESYNGSKSSITKERRVRVDLLFV